MNVHRSEIPEDPDDPDQIYNFEADDREFPSDDASEESVLASKDSLDEIDEELAAAGKLPEKAVDDILAEDDESEASELSEESLKSFADELRQTWERLGVIDPHNVTADSLRDLGPDIILQLDLFTAELLYFDTYKKIWDKLGFEPVTTKALFGQLKPPVDPSLPSTPIDLVKLRTDKRTDAFVYLRSLDIDHEELNESLLGSPQQQHDTVRLAHVISEEPSLNELRADLVASSGNRFESMKVLKLARLTRGALKGRVHDFREDMRVINREGRPMEYIDHVQYARAMGSVERSLALVDEVVQHLQSDAAARAVEESSDEA